MSQTLIVVASLVMFITLSVEGVGNYRVICATVLMLSSFGHVLALSLLSNHLLLTISNVRRTFSLLDETPIVEAATGQQSSQFGDSYLYNITLKYDNEHVLNNINLSILQCKMTAIIGKKWKW